MVIKIVPFNWQGIAFISIFAYVPLQLGRMEKALFAFFLDLKR